MWQCPDTLINSYLRRINSFDSKIKFTFEIEQNSKQPYLDVLLMKTHQGIERIIYRYPISDLSIILHNAETPFLYKVSAFRHSNKELSLIVS